MTSWNNLSTCDKVLCILSLLSWLIVPFWLVSYVLVRSAVSLVSRADD